MNPVNFSIVTSQEEAALASGGILAAPSAAFVPGFDQVILTVFSIIGETEDRAERVRLYHALRGLFKRQLEMEMRRDVPDAQMLQNHFYSLCDIGEAIRCAHRESSWKEGAQPA